MMDSEASTLPQARFKLTDIALDDWQEHPRLAGRITGTVRVTLRETRADEAQDHVLTVRAWTDRRPDMNDADVEMALLIRAGEIVARVKGRLENTVYPQLRFEAFEASS